MTADILHRLTTAPAGSRELDEAVAGAAGWKKGIHHGSSQYQRQDGRWFFNVPAFTTDLNTTFAEAQRRGLFLRVTLHKQGKSAALCGNEFGGINKESATPALAACAALIAEIGDQP